MGWALSFIVFRQLPKIAKVIHHSIAVIGLIAILFVSPYFIFMLGGQSAVGAFLINVLVGMFYCNFLLVFLAAVWAIKVFSKKGAS